MPRPAETSIFFHCALSFDGVYALLSVYYNDPVGQFACPFCKRYFLLFLYVATQKPPRLPVTETGVVHYALFVLSQALTRLLAGVLDRSLGGCQNYRALDIILLPPGTAQLFLLN